MASAACNDRDLATQLLQSELTTKAYEAAERPLTSSISGNPDAELALRLQRMEVMTAEPLDVDDADNERIAMQMYEQELFEQEQHDATVARELENEEMRNHRKSGGRVPNISEALGGMHRNNRGRRNENMNFSRSVRGPSMIVPQPGLDVYGPGIFVEQDIDADGEESILPRPRRRPTNLRMAGNLNIPGIADESPPSTPDVDDLPLPGQFRGYGDQPGIHPAERRHNNHTDGGRAGNIIHALRRNLHGQFGNLIMNYQRRDDDIDFDDYEALWELQERNGDVGQKGLTKDQIHRIPHHKFKSKPDLNQTLKSDKTTCSICLCNYTDGENIKTLPCFHSYHKSCIDQWIKSKAVCPVCRVNIKT